MDNVNNNDGTLAAIEILENGTEKELKEEIVRQTAAGKKNKNRFIMSIGSPVTPSTSTQRVNKYYNYVHDLSSIL